MTPMLPWRRNFLLALLIGWVVLSVAGFLYAREKSVPPALAVPIIAAFLFEYPFYLLPGFVGARERLAERLMSPVLAALLAVSALAPYLIYSLGTGQFRWGALARLAVLAGAVAFWYVVRQPSPTADLAFLALLAAPVLMRFFDWVYTSPLLNLQVEVLGQLMLIRLAATAVLIFRKPEGVGFGFWPTAREWKIGLLHFAMFMPVGFALALGIGLFRFEPSLTPWWKPVGSFVGMLWVVALSEEFLFRGLLQRWLTDWLGRPQAALLAAALLFGSVHLWFREFPNWRFALVAAVAGWFYGRAYRVAGGIRAAMVAHALTNVVARTLFT